MLCFLPPLPEHVYLSEGDSLSNKQVPVTLEALVKGKEFTFGVIYITNTNRWWTKSRRLLLFLFACSLRQWLPLPNHLGLLLLLRFTRNLWSAFRENLTRSEKYYCSVRTLTTSRSVQKQLLEYFEWQFECPCNISVTGSLYWVASSRLSACPFIRGHHSSSQHTGCPSWHNATWTWHLGEIQPGTFSTVSGNRST